MNLKKFYNFSESFTDKEIAFRDNFWGPKLPRHNIPSPNFLTIVRIVGSIFLVLYPLSTIPFFSMVVFLFLTDYFDGIIARTQDKETLFGIWADPIADRMLLLSVVYFLYLQNHAFWIQNFLKILIPEGIILLLGVVLLLQGRSIIPRPNAWGRMKCFCYFLAMIFFLFNSPNVSSALITAGVVFSCISIVAYSSRLGLKFKTLNAR